MAKEGRTLGDLRKLRTDAGLRLAKAANKIGTDHSMLIRYEATEVKLPARLVGPMADAYGTTVTQVLAANERDWLRREETNPTPAPRPRRAKKQVSA